MFFPDQYSYFLAGPCRFLLSTKAITLPVMFGKTTARNSVNKETRHRRLNPSCADLIIRGEKKLTSLFVWNHRIFRSGGDCGGIFVPFSTLCISPVRSSFSRLVLDTSTNVVRILSMRSQCLYITTVLA